MKIPETYEEFLKINRNDFNKLATSNLSLAEWSKLMQFINLLANDLKDKNIVLEKIEKNKTIGEIINGEDWDTRNIWRIFENTEKRFT